MNFMERLEEGLSEEAVDVTTHLRISQYQKNDGPKEDSDDDETEATYNTAATVELNRRSSSIVIDDIEFHEESKSEI